MMRRTTILLVLGQLGAPVGLMSSCGGEPGDDWVDELEPGDEPLDPAGSGELTSDRHAGAFPGFAVEIAVDGDDVALTWDAAPDTEYHVYATNGLAGPPGAPTPIVGAAGSTLVATGLGLSTYTDEGAAEPHPPESLITFYQVLASGPAGDATSTVVAKVSTAAGEGYTKLGLCLLDGPSTASELRSELGDAVQSIHTWDETTQSWRWWWSAFGDGPFGDLALPFGGSVSVRFDETVAPYVTLVGTVPTDEPPLSSVEGLNILTTPITGWVLGIQYPNAGMLVGGNGKFDGVGRWNVDTQTVTWRRSDGGSEFEVEPCHAYYFEQGASEPVLPPPGVFPQFGGLEITTSSTALQALTDAVLYLVSYPFECSEQIASRVLAIAALRDVLEAFDAEGLPPPKQLVAAVERDLDRLRRMQTDDGGFSFWGRGWPSWPYLTVHVAHALERAREKGFKPNIEMRKQVLVYLDDIESHIDPDYPADVRRVIRAYALYVLRLAGQPNARKAQALVDEVELEKQPLEALAWVLPTLHEDAKAKSLADRIERHLGNRVTETAAMAHFATEYADGEHLVLHSDRRVDALVVEALATTEPKSDLIPKLVRGLLGHRKAGRWESTQENAFVLVALDRYFNQYEKATPDFVAKAWLGEQFAGQHAFKGRTTEQHLVEVPMKWLADHEGKQDLVIDKQGKGRLYYRVGMRYAPRDLKLPPYDAGFVVERRYEAVDDEGDVKRDADGTWHIKSGARVRVRLTMVADGRRYHVALVDPLPAGLEALNPALATTGALPADPKGEGEGGGGWWWWRTWYEHQNLRDERVEAFTSLLWSGVYDYDYVARATTPGRFVVPPTKAEEMYHPETFGRGSGDVVVVE